MESYEENRVKWLIDKPGGLFLTRRRLRLRRARVGIMGKRNKMIIVCGILVIVFIVIYGILTLKKFLNITGLDYETIGHSTPIEFKERRQTIFITTRIFGLGGQHFHTIISEIDHANNAIFINKEKEIVLDGICGFYYKTQEPDSLLIFFSSGSYSEGEIIYREVSGIKVKITKYKATMNNYYKNYKELGLSRISCYDEIK